MSHDLARRAVACKGWHWTPGMLTLPFHEDNDRSRPECYPPWRLTREGVAGPWAHDPTWGALPDLTDPATLGCLLALVREAWNDPTIGAVQAGDYKTAVAGLTIPSRSHWLVMRAGAVGLDVHKHGDTEAEALVKALEAAP